MVKYLANHETFPYNQLTVNIDLAFWKNNIAYLIYFALIQYKVPSLVSLFLKYNDIANDLVGVINCLSLATQRGCQQSVEYLIEKIEAHALSLYPYICALLKTALCESFSKSITKACYLLWQKSVDSYCALCILYKTIVNGFKLDIPTTWHEMRKMKFRLFCLCFTGQYVPISIEMVYSAAYLGLKPMIKLIFLFKDFFFKSLFDFILFNHEENKTLTRHFTFILTHSTFHTTRTTRRHSYIALDDATSKTENLVYICIFIILH